MRNLLALVVCLSLFLGLQGVPGVYARPAQSSANSTITLWHNWYAPQLPAIQQVLAQYEADHPGVTINLYRPDDMSAELDAAIPAGTGPDIINWSNDPIGTLVAKKQIIDLDQLGITNGWLSSTYQPEAVQGVKYVGKIWALPFFQEGLALLYNKALVTSDYLPVDRLDFAGLRSKAQAFMTATGKPLICNQGFPGGDAYHVAPVFFGFGVPTYVDDWGHGYANTPEAITAGTWLASMAPLSPEPQSHSDCNAALLAGNVGMWWTGPWAIPELNQPGFQYGIAQMGKSFVTIRTLMVTTNARDRGNTTLALDILQTLANAENSRSIALANMAIPSNTAALNDPTVQALPVLAGFAAATSNGVAQSPSPYTVCQWGPISDAEIAMWNGSAAPADALNLAQAQIRACVQGLQTFIYVPVIKK